MRTRFVMELLIAVLEVGVIHQMTRFYTTVQKKSVGYQIYLYSAEKFIRIN